MTCRNLAFSSMGDCRNGVEEQDCPRPEVGQRSLAGWTRNHIPLGTAQHQQGTEHQPELHGIQLSTTASVTYPRDAVTSGPWQLSKSSKLRPPQALSYTPQYSQGLSFLLFLLSLIGFHKVCK